MQQTRQLGLMPTGQVSAVWAFGGDYEPGFVIPTHRHDAAQLIHAVEGVMTVSTEDGIWVVPPGRAVWVPTEVGHGIRMTGRVGMRTVYFRPGAQPLVDPRCSVVQVSVLLRAAIMRAVEFGDGYPEDGAEARLIAVLVDEIRVAPVAPLHLPMPSDDRARTVALALRATPGDRRRLADWGRVAGASERTLERLFRAEVGMTFSRWRQQARLLRGLEQLAVGDPVTRVAADLGFDHASAFIAMFRRALGTTPGRYFKSAAK